MGQGESGWVGASTYTFLFTDVEGSTRRWEVDPGEMSEALAVHDRTLSEAVEAHQGLCFKHTGDGIGAVFPSAPQAALAAVAAQRELVLPVRMAVHTGQAIPRGSDFFGQALNRCARLVDVAHGRQIVLSAASAALAGQLGPEMVLLDLGEHRLRDLTEPERVFQVMAPGLQKEFPRLRSLDVVRHNLPVLRSSFIGRERELADLSERVMARQVVTLTGVGGCGKTRLALETAGKLVDRFPQGVFFVDLALVSDPGLLGQAVANALDLHVVNPDIESLARHLRERRLLLLLDNCEHVLDASAELVDGLLTRCLELHVLATSREALRVEGEQVFSVPSLQYDTDAVHLFADRARASGAITGLDSTSEATVTAICERLDGIPLAIELAAVRAAHLAPQQILDRLADRFRLLTGGRRGVQRQQTLAAAIDWSHALLSDQEQTLFRRLAVFRGSFSLEAVEEVCHPNAIDVLGSLIAKSLVNVDRSGAAPRYRLLETVRLYAEERLLVSGEAAELRDRHRDWLLRWIEGLPAGRLIVGDSGSELAAEIDNLTAALEWSREQGRLDLVARMASRMVGYWWSYLRVAELAAWWDVVRRGLAGLSPGVRAQALVIGFDHATLSGDFDQLEKLSAEALAAASPGSWVEAYAWSRQALYWTHADPDRGRHHIEEGRRRAQSAGLPEFEELTAVWGVNPTLGAGADEPGGARQLVDELLPRIDPNARYGWVLGGIAAALGNTSEASQLARALPRRTPFQRYSQEFVEIVIAIAEDRTEAAAEHVRALAAVVREHAIPLGEESCLLATAALAVRAGDYATASRHLASVRAAAPFPFRSPLEVFIYRQTAVAVRGALDPDLAANLRAEGAATYVSRALDAELTRLQRIDTAGAH